MTLLEMMLVLAASLIICLIGLGFSTRWIEHERLRSATLSLASHLHQARMEAVSRNRPCRFVLDTGLKAIRILDLNDILTDADDVPIASINLPARIEFARPDGGSAITLSLLGGGIYGTVYASDGSILSGAGEIHLAASGLYREISLFVAGGTRIRRWDDTTWRDGI